MDVDTIDYLRWLVKSLAKHIPFLFTPLITIIPVPQYDIHLTTVHSAHYSMFLSFSFFHHFNTIYLQAFIKSVGQPSIQFPLITSI